MRALLQSALSSNLRQVGIVRTLRQGADNVPRLAAKPSSRPLSHVFIRQMTGGATESAASIPRGNSPLSLSNVAAVI